MPAPDEPDPFEFNPPEPDPVRVAEMLEEIRQERAREDHRDALMAELKARAAAAPPAEAEALGREYEMLHMMTYFYLTVQNSGRIFGFTNILHEQRDGLKAIGATGCLRALEGLWPIFQAMERLPTRPEQDEYRWATEAAQLPFEEMAEGYEVLRELVITYLEKLLALPSHP